MKSFVTGGIDEGDQPVVNICIYSILNMGDIFLNWFLYEQPCWNKTKYRTKKKEVHVNTSLLLHNYWKILFH